MMAWSYQPPSALTDSQFQLWQRLVEERTGIDLSQHRSILQSGLNRRLRELDGGDYDAYYEQVVRLPEGLAEWQALVDCLTVQETSFFRQPAAYDLVRNYLRERLSSPYSTPTLDLWSAGCATGEEAYSLAMVADEAIEACGAEVFLGVFATDISGAALRRVRAGHFAARRLQVVPEPLRQRYFQSTGDDGFEVVPALRERVCCSQANLLQLERLPPLSMDVIFCQNVLVYFRRWRTRQVLDALVERLKPGGLLVVGPGEAVHWQHPGMVAAGCAGVSAYLRRPSQPAGVVEAGVGNEYRTE